MRVTLFAICVQAMLDLYPECITGDYRIIRIAHKLLQLWYLRYLN